MEFTWNDEQEPAQQQESGNALTFLLCYILKNIVFFF